MADIPDRLKPVTYAAEPADTQEGVKRERVRQVRQSLAVVANVVNDQRVSWESFLAEIGDYPENAKSIEADLKSLLSLFIVVPPQTPRPAGSK